MLNGARLGGFLNGRSKSSTSKFREVNKLRRKPAVESLEGRRLPSASTPDLVVRSATTADSKSVTIQYDLNAGATLAPLTFGVYRSADPRLDATSIPVATVPISPSVAPVLDAEGVPATAPGPHTLTVALPGGLPPNPLHPFVVVVANPASASTNADPAGHTASFRKHVIAVITHGGLQPRSWRIDGPPWERKLASLLRQQGYDVVFPFNWVGESSHPGRAAQEGPRVANRVVQASNLFPTTEPVDLQLIGHSEGASINSVALKKLLTTATPQLKAGYVVDTMLDPHAANNSAPGGRQFAVMSGYKGWFARQAIKGYQAKARDPIVSVPANVDDAQVYYQRTPTSLVHGSGPTLYNLWGQVPVLGKATYYNLTGPGISHAGLFNVPSWYNLNVAPGLGNGTFDVGPKPLTGGRTGGLVSTTHRVTLSGMRRAGIDRPRFGRPRPRPSPPRRQGDRRARRHLAIDHAFAPQRQVQCPRPGDRPGQPLATEAPRHPEGQARPRDRPRAQGLESGLTPP